MRWRLECARTGKGEIKKTVVVSLPHFRTCSLLQRIIFQPPIARASAC